MSIVDEMVVKIKADLDNIFGEVEKISNAEDAFAFISTVIVCVEKRALEFEDLTGSQKKEIAVKVINSYVDMPVLPEWLEAKVISHAIDMAINILNKYVGKLWGSVIPDETKS